MARMIIFGGKSVESGISVITALQAAEYFTGAKLIYIDNDKWKLVKHGCTPADLSDPKFLEKCPEARTVVYISGAGGDGKKSSVPKAC